MDEQISSLFDTDQTYEDLISYVIEIESDELIENENITHARTLIENLISNKVPVKDYIGIFSLNFNKECFGQTKIIEKFKEKLEKKVRFKLLFQKRPSSDAIKENPLLCFFLECEKYMHLIEIKCLKADKADSHDKHLITTNAGAFRLETSHSKSKAVAAFNNPPIGNEVRNYFEKLFTDRFSEPINLFAFKAAK